MLCCRKTAICLLLLSGAVAFAAGDPAATAPVAMPLVIVPAAPPPPPPAVVQMLMTGDAGDPLLAFPGFGATVVQAAAFELSQEKPLAWQDTKEGKTLTSGAWTVELRRLPPDWQKLRASLPKPGAKDDVSVRKILWSGVSSWLVDITVLPNGAAGKAGERQRYLIAPVAGEILLLSFRGPADSFAAERATLRDIAKSVRFRINGLIAEYHASENLDKLRRVQVDTTINFVWGTDAPSEDVGPDMFSVRWTGKVRARTSETYTFTTISDDGVRLWIDGRPVIDNWTVHAATENTAVVEMEAGKDYDLKMEWFEHTIDATAQLAWQSPTQLREIVPAENLSCQPEPFFAPVPQPYIDGREVEGLPALLYGERPGTFTVTPPAGLKWQGTPGNQRLTLGKGENAVEVTLKKLPTGLLASKSALPSFGADDKVSTQAILWQNAPTWQVDCELDAKLHPEAKLHCQRHYLVPLRRGLLLLSFAATTPDWLELNHDAFLAAFKSVRLLAELETDDATAADGVF